MKVHFYNGKKFRFWYGNAACGQRLCGDHKETQPKIFGFQTTIPSRVTCEKCKKTQVYKDAIK